MGITKELRGHVGEKCALMERGDQRLQAYSMAQSEEIQAADAENVAGSETGSAGGRIEGRGAAADPSYFGADADIHRIAPGFFDGVKHVLGGLVAIGVLDSSVHARENAEVIEPPLAVADL